MRKLLFLIILFTACDSSENHGNLSIFNEPSEEQLSKWIEIEMKKKTIQNETRFVF